jgi:hypothetical protein
MRMRALAIAAVAALGAAACAPMEASAPAVPVAGGPQRCNAADAQSLVGTHVGVVTFASDANVRIVCTTCPTTRDLRPDRLNVRFDQATGVIKSVDCG